MTVEPIVSTVKVKASPARAFDLFANHMGEYWPKGRTIGGNAHVAIVAEPRADGGWYEIDADGKRTSWGKVLAWEPPARLLLTWQIGTQWTFDEDLRTEVEITFTAADGGGTWVRLEHRDLERFGADAAKHAALLNGGWPTHLAEFAKYADAQTEEASTHV